MSDLDRLRKTLGRQFSEALVDHQMISEGDHILVGLSGGKDSWALLHLLVDLRPRAPVSYRLSAVTIDGGLMGLDPAVLERECAKLDVPFHLVRQRIFETVAEKKDPDTTFCSMCAKLRRGALYQVAHDVNATKIALGHHLDDAVETLFLNLFYGGRLAAMPPVLVSDSGHATILRPLIYCDEPTISAFSAAAGFPTVGCACPVCPTHPEYEHNDLKRFEIKKWIAQRSLEIPELRSHFRAALRKLEITRFLDPRYTARCAESSPNSFVPHENQVDTPFHESGFVLHKTPSR